MKKISFLLVVAMAFLAVGCEKQPALDKRYHEQNKAYDKAMGELAK